MLPKNKIPGKSVERLSKYRRYLLSLIKTNKHYVFSHEIATSLNITSVQVRRDLMHIGYNGSNNKGYDVRELIDTIGLIIDDTSEHNIAIIGVGNLGRALISYLWGKRSNLNIVAAFDNDPEKIDRLISGVNCYHVSKLEEIIKKFNIKIAIISTTAESAEEIAKTVVIAGVTAILNYTPTPLKVSSNIFVEEYDIITSLEKVAYFAKQS
ncbi:MAG: hypothetical protein A2X12_11165 [Bacteroidetes bacterium GWE2_29_8]|nr:MAG: hypothetical protein A2X12_11165 [Bacteroidetes bacterium GWE2_29_8]OFY22339.1 MAG: hypothetical protein A2X02_07645 [Bacteroidetes bacterium GWF2_29_10]